MGSMTRNRCIDDGKPGPAQVKHYVDRARDGAGHIVVEGIFVDWTGCDWSFVPFMITSEHAQAWPVATDAVHEVGGKIFFQAWHAGRCQHNEMPIMKKHGGVVLAPSAVKANAGKYRDLSGKPVSEMNGEDTHNVVAIQEQKDVIEIYRRSCLLAKQAGFDGVELLAQGGYLPHQFLNSRVNRRTDANGGSVENRCRFVIELAETLATIFDGLEFVCVKLNPTDFYNDSETYTYLIKELIRRKVGIINLSRRGADTSAGIGDFFGIDDRPEGYVLLRGYDPVLDFISLVKFPGSASLLMANHDYTPEEADSLMKERKLDLITFGRPFIYNPDIVNRIRHSIAFAENNRGNKVFYGPYRTPDENYNDWPVAPFCRTPGD
ncbi:hypothetical protein BDP55DRAFT_699009 [Colletotrichum godetiae]|uniref:NADH:flavin oxidoreductase/NADH oxidase N-terminal domain-containing protein n=1 Tax=Colletotrichum godetiae TaxID=1209918 RepID=A0AAJ0A9B3_9PEZI|nr:uncharacterized protein BDP55DRAFT_699009 [Colletotrichum godetiae]KAK1657431.1 hypothetical protein BDP55DRAFT_699009 [Colletotrichum godetiae]